MTSKQRTGREWVIFLFFFPLGIAAMFYVGQAAISQPPVWSVKAEMKSYIDPNNYFSSNPDIIEPLRMDILTKPAWENTYLTPGGYTGGDDTPPQLATATQQNPDLPTPTASLIPTYTPIPTNTIVPTSTYIYYPPTETQKTPSPPTDTPIPPAPSADLSISKTDGVATYTPGNSTTYTIIISNNGPEDIVGIQIADNLLTQITSWDWACTTVTNASGCDPAIASATNFTDTVDIQNGGSITYTVTAYISADASGDLVNTATVSGGTDSNLANNTSSDTDTLQRFADLAISKNAPTDTYKPGDIITYTVIVSNNGPSNVSGFDILDPVPAEITGVSVNCTTSGTANCGTDAQAGNNISFTGASINAGVGNEIKLSISGTVASGTTANITNTADILISGGASFTDATLSNNSSSHSHQRVYDLPYGKIGGSKDGITTNIGSGNSVILNITTQVNGHAGWDLVYYELPNGSGCPGEGIMMDWVILQVGDGTNWYTVLNWGDGVVDANANIASVGLPESDSRSICSANLYNATGVALDLDTLVPPGTYPYIRIIAPTGDGDGVVEVDAITPLP